MPPQARTIVIARLLLLSILSFPPLVHAQSIDSALVNRLLSRATDGSVSDQVRLAREYIKSGRPEDAAQAFHWYSLAANSGDPQAQTALGMMYEDGIGAALDAAAAAQWYRRAAAEGSPAAQGRLGILYYRGNGVPQDRHEGFLLIRRAAQAGEAAAQANLGYLLLFGDGVPRDDAAALRWLRKGAQRDGSAAFNLGWCYESGRGIGRDPKEAMDWYRRAAERGFGPAENNLGRMYEDGLGIPADSAKALEHYRRAAGLGIADGILNLGRLYLSAPVPVRDQHAGVLWLAIARRANALPPEWQSSLDAALQALTAAERDGLDSAARGWIEQHPLSDRNRDALVPAQSAGTRPPQ